MSLEKDEELKKSGGTEKKDEAKEAPKKKKYITVFKPQNASSTEMKNIAKQQKQQQKKAAKAPEPEKKMVKVRKADGTIMLVDSSTIVRKPKTAKAPESKPSDDAAKATEAETVKDKEMPAPKVKAADAVDKKAEAVKKVQISDDESSKAAVSEKTSEAVKPAKTENEKAKSDEASIAGDVSEKKRSTQTKNDQMGNKTSEKSVREDGRSADKRSARPFERNKSADGRPRRNTEGVDGERSYRRSDDGQRKRPFDSKNADGTNQNRQGRTGRDGKEFSKDSRPFSRDNRTGGRFDNHQSKDDDRQRRDGSDSRRRSDKDKKSVSASAAATLGIKKQTGRANSKDKDKNKDSLRENRFNDKVPGNRPNQGRKQTSNLPKALQKPVHKHPEEKKEVVTEITLPEKITIRELAEKMKMQPAAIVKKLFMEGTMVTVNQEIDFEKAQEIALSFDIIAEQEEKVDVIEELLREDTENEEDMTPRPPVVCVMGHVDHGKTSLLDAIRDAHVTDREAGGITQHIGAYVVPINGQKITFLDTPGHEAFTAMRMRGANSTDIAILVVAADDGVMPQTVEAINHAKAASVEIIVAINKIDKPGANVDRVKQELMEYQLVPEEWGGSTIFAEVSAKTHEGIKNLLEMILLTAEVMELKANKNRKARGLVLEAKLDKGKGPVANVLVQKGTLKLGDYIAAGSCSGKVRAMMDENSRQLKEAGPSTPVEILGLNGVPNAGEILVAFASDKEAKSFAATFVAENKNKLVEDTKSKMSLDDLFSQIKEGNLKELNLIVKADVQGSVEAMKQSLLKLSNEEVVVKIVHGGVGAINESDITLAATSNAIVIGFNVRPDAQAKAIAEEEGVDLRLYKVIYQAIEDVERAMKGMLDPIYEEKVIGHAEIRQIFKASGVGNIAGSYVLDGTFERGCKVRISRAGKQIYEGALASLKRFKDDVKEVKAGYECGLVFENFGEIEELDIVEAYVMVEVPRT